MLPFLFCLFLLFLSSSSERCPEDWISVDFHSRNSTNKKKSYHRYDIKLSLKVRANKEKNLEICGRVYTDQYYETNIPSFRFYFREGGERANGFFESSQPIMVPNFRINAGESYSFRTTINSTESSSFKHLPKIIEVVSLNTSVFLVQDYFFVSSAFFSEYFLSKSKEILMQTSPLKKICIPIFGTSGHGKNAIASHLTSITTPLARMLHPSGAGKGIDQTTNQTYPQFIVGDIVQILQTVGFEESSESEESNEKNDDNFWCSNIEKFVNETIQGEIAKEYNCYPFVALYIISTAEANENVYQSHFCSVKYITGILNSVHKQVISTYTLFNYKGRELSNKDRDQEYQKLLFKPPEQNVIWLDLNMDNLERDFEKDIVLMTLLTDVLEQHLMNFKEKRRKAKDDLRSNKLLSYDDLLILDMNIRQYITRIIWQNLSFGGIRRIWKFFLIYVIPHIMRRYIFEFLRSLSPFFFDVCYGLFGGFSTEMMSLFLGYGGFGVLAYFISRRFCCSKFNIAKIFKKDNGNHENDVIRRRQSSIPRNLLNNNIRYYDHDDD